MRARHLVLAAFAATALSACATTDRDGMYDDGPPGGPPVGPGALVGTMAADRDGDGVVDGYYTPDGAYVPFRAPPCPPPPPPPPPPGPRGERG